MILFGEPPSKIKKYSIILLYKSKEKKGEFVLFEVDL